MVVDPFPNESLRGLPGEGLDVNSALAQDDEPMVPVLELRSRIYRIEFA
jgi:hypothetical protein